MGSNLTWELPHTPPWTMAGRFVGIAHHYYMELKDAVVHACVPMRPGERFPFGGAAIQAHRGAFLHRMGWEMVLYRMLYEENDRDVRAVRAEAYVNYKASKEGRR